MKIKKSICAVLISMLTVAAGGLIAQQGGMQMPPGMQMPSPEEVEKMMKQQVTMMVDQMFPQGDTDGDGEMTFDEFEKMVSQSMGGGGNKTEEEKAKEIKDQFETADVDDSDTVTKEEMIAAILNDFNKVEGDAEEEEDSEDEAAEEDEEMEDEDMEDEEE